MIRKTTVENWGLLMEGGGGLTKKPSVQTTIVEYVVPHFQSIYKIITKNKN